jgi:hypothetical protein
MLWIRERDTVNRMGFSGISEFYTNQAIMVIYAITTIIEKD